MKTATQLKDMQGKEIKVGDRVAMVSWHNAGSLVIGVVEKLGTVRAQVRPVKASFTNIDPTVASIGSTDLIKL